MINLPTLLTERYHYKLYISYFNNYFLYVKYENVKNRNFNSFYIYLALQKNVYFNLSLFAR